eukprot:gene3651-4559_t
MEKLNSICEGAVLVPRPAVIARRREIAADLADLLPAGCLISDERGLKPFETDAFIAYRRMPLLV